MRKFITFMMVFAFTLPILAQFDGSTRHRFNHSNVEQYYGLRLGLNLAAINSSTASIDMGSYAGLAIGGVYGLQLANSTPIWLEAGLFYSENGGKEDHYESIYKPANGSEVGYTQKRTVRLMYLKTPIVIKYALDIADDLYLQPFLGGYLALGVGGKTKEYGNERFNVERTSYDSFDNFKRFDGGLRVGCGIEYQMIYAELGFDFGLANISDDEFDTARNQNLFINIGVNF